MHDIRMSIPLTDQTNSAKYPPSEKKYPKMVKPGTVKNGIMQDKGVIVESEAEENAWLAAQAAKESSRTEDDGEPIRRGPGRPPKVAELA